jgi:Rrf2 family protein
VRISAKADYAVRAMVHLAAAELDRGRANDRSVSVKAQAIADAQDIPVRFLLGILSELRVSGLVRSQRGADGGFTLAHRPEDIAVADVIRAVEGPLANVSDLRPDEIDYAGSAAALKDVWIAVRASLRKVLEVTTIADVARGKLPKSVTALLADDEAWLPH